jgi:hypothetical protein
MRECKGESAENSVNDGGPALKYLDVALLPKPVTDETFHHFTDGDNTLFNTEIA